MPYLATIFLLLATAGLAVAQTFSPLPGPVLEKELAFQQANECYIFFDNPSGDTLQLRWRQIEASVPAGWKTDLCDYGLCYTGIPANGTMNPVFDTVQAYLKLVVQPDTIPGSAWLHFRVFEKGHEDNKTEVYFSLFTPGTTSSGIPEGGEIRVFPNPASRFLCLENRGGAPQQVCLSDVSGRRVLMRSLTPGDPECLDLPELPGGTYYLQSGRQTQKILIQK